MVDKSLTDAFITYTKKIGFGDIAFTSPTLSENNIKAYSEWINNNMHGDMRYMTNVMRINPKDFLPDAKSVIMLATPYKQPHTPFENGYGIVASYARGRDYHKILNKRLKKLLFWLENHVDKQNTVVFTDTKPILEKALAVQSGLGHFGRNSLVIHRRFGTFFFLSGLITTVDFPKTISKWKDICRKCYRCIDACPTQAIVKPYIVDARLCLSYNTIETKSMMPKKIASNNPGYIFGCDICQDVCPHNIKPKVTNDPDFQPAVGVGAKLKLDELHLLPGDHYHGTVLQRRKPEGLTYTAKTLLESNKFS
ncbi:tRNA epoxyqueuosine(34) reductase QueG [Chlamydiia bacterium]|nr:tRNA epoxyqueuosine(34) reductase QueG [Chlamydiia bacterium]